MAVAKFEFTLLMPTLASIDVNAAKKADKNARNAHRVNYLIKKILSRVMRFIV